MTLFTEASQEGDGAVVLLMVQKSSFASATDGVVL